MKHHRNYVCDLILHFDGSMEELPKLLLSVGQSQMDMYIGKLSPEQIEAEIASQLRQNKRFNEKAFKKWLLFNNHFQTMVISDQSQWTLRSGDSEHYIHIHPGRHSIQSVRIKAGILKTVIAILVALHKKEIDEIEIGSVNMIRTQFLKLSPIKAISSNSHLYRIIQLMQSRIIDVSAGM